MPLTKEEKQKALEELKEKIDKQKSIVFTDFTGIKVKDLSNLRKKIKEENGELKVAKKTLISLALKEKNIALDAKQLKGELALGFGYKDEVSPFKLLYDFSKGNDKLKILGGLIGKEFYDSEKSIELAKMPTREELVAKLLFAPKVPIFSIFNILQRSISIININH
ncbi:MAG: 50S ribosomal protein L10 [Candidatus Nealsonbacteria bacterium]|nr:50S ribosomal protein L10 [Candidatus Nealsonbacteria bacterium]